MATALASLDAKGPQPFPLAIATLRARHIADFGAAVSLRNVCRSLLYELLMYFLLTWLPFYLMHERHFSLATMAKIAGSAYFLMAVAATSAGWVSDRCIASGETPSLVRKTFMVVGQVGAGISLAACVAGGPVLSVACL